MHCQCLNKSVGLSAAGEALLAALWGHEGSWILPSPDFFLCRRGPAQDDVVPPLVAKKRQPVSPKVRAQRVQQGKYLAALRGLSVQQRAQVKQAKAEGDYTAALKVAAGLQKKTA